MTTPTTILSLEDEHDVQAETAYFEPENSELNLKNSCWLRFMLGKKNCILLCSYCT